MLGFLDYCVNIDIILEIHYFYILQIIRDDQICFSICVESMDYLALTVTTEDLLHELAMYFSYKAGAR